MIECSWGWDLIKYKGVWREECKHCMEDRCDSQSWVAGCPGRPFYALLSPVTASEMLLLVFISRAHPCGQWQQFQHNLIIPEGNDFQYAKSVILQNGTKRYIISFPATPGLQHTVKILFERKEWKKGREKTEREQILIVGSLHLSFSFLWLKYEFFYSQTLRLFFCQSELWKGLQQSATAPCQTCSTKPFPWTNSALLSSLFWPLIKKV